MAIQRLSIVGGGWAGLAAAVAGCEAGYEVTLYEASKTLGGRARSLAQTWDNTPLDNGQHILIGAYSATLDLMRKVGLKPEALLQRLPLDLRFADGQGLALPQLVAPLNALIGIASARGWQVRDKWVLLKACITWQRWGFSAPTHWSVADLHSHGQLTPTVVQTLIEPLCLSALNTPMAQASANVFLRVLHDALLGPRGSSDLLLPSADLSALLPQACHNWLSQRGVQMHLGHRLDANDVMREVRHSDAQHHLVLATPSWEAARLSAQLNPVWSAQAAALSHMAIATVYVHCADPAFQGLPRPMVALHSNATQPAQFVFCRTRLMQQNGLLAGVVSACDMPDDMTSDQLAKGVLHQLQQQLGLQRLQVVQTIVEKRATFACTPTLHRPSAAIAPRVWACGDYVEGPYPATLEGAVRSGLQVIAQL